MSLASSGDFFANALVICRRASSLGTALKDVREQCNQRPQPMVDLSQLDLLIDELWQALQAFNDTNKTALPGGRKVAKCIARVADLCNEVRNARSINRSDDSFLDAYPAFLTAANGISDALKDAEECKGAYAAAQTVERPRAEAKQSAAQREWNEMHRRDRLEAAWNNVYVTMPSVQDGRGIDYPRWGQKLADFCDVLEREGAAQLFLCAQPPDEDEKEAINLIQLGLNGGEIAIAKRLRELSQSDDREWMRVFNSLDLFSRTMVPSQIGPHEPTQTSEEGDCEQGPEAATIAAPNDSDKDLDVESQPTGKTPFSGGTMVFFRNRVELCDVVIYRGRRSNKTRKALELLAKRREGTFVEYSTETMAEKLGVEKDNVVGIIRDLRERISKALAEASVICGREDVILSRPYRLSNKLTVQQVHNGNRLPRANSDGLVSGPVNGLVSGPVMARRDKILLELAKGRELRVPAIATEFTCSRSTAKRDMDWLRCKGKVEFTGAPRTGYYRLLNPPSTSQ